MILVIDNYDSFTYNLVQYIGELGAELMIRRNDKITIDEIAKLSLQGIVLSPGPCTPKESGVCLDIVSAAMNEHIRIPIFGVCLGHQAIGHMSHSIVAKATRIVHGKSSLIEHDQKGLFSGIPTPFSAIRYHSLSIIEDTLSPDLVVTARSTDDNEIMGIRHKTLPIEGLQFHPESVLTEHGKQIIQNFLQSL